MHGRGKLSAANIAGRTHISAECRAEGTIALAEQEFASSSFKAIFAFLIYSRLL
jgi:hypothetical protein